VKFLFFSTQFVEPWLGSEELWSRTASHMLAQGHEVAFAYRHWPDRPARLKELEAKGARAFYMGDPAAKAGFVTRAVRVLKRKLKIGAVTNTPHVLVTQCLEFKPDAVYVSADEVYEADWMAPAFEELKRLGIPAAIGSQRETEWEHLSDYRRSDLQRSFRAVTLPVFVSRHGLEMMRRQLALPLKDAVVVRNPTASSGQPVRWPAVTSSTRMIACVARINCQDKGQDIIFEVLSQPLWRDRDWKLTLYGKGWDERYLAELAALYQLTDRIVFAGHVHGIDKVWAENELFVLASRREGSPLALIEACYAGRAAVVTDIGGNAEWVEEGRTGWIAEAPSVRSFGAALERAWTHRDAWPEMGQAARRLADARDPDPCATLSAHLIELASRPSVCP